MSEDPKFIPKGEEIGPNPNLIQPKDKKPYPKFIRKNIKVAKIK